MAETGSTPNPLTLDTDSRLAALTPLREPIFRSLWIAAVVSYTGTWMQNVGAGWLMTSLTTNPLMVGLVQAAASLPVFLVVLPAGALADIVDRRRLLMLTQSWMVVASAALGVLTLLGHVTPWMLLAFTFLLGLGAVMNDPAWQAITPEIVSPRQLTSAIALNSAGFNVARAVGPALGGVIIALAGSGSVFLLNAVSFFGVIFFLYRWKRPHTVEFPHTGTVLDAILSGLRYVRTASGVQAVLIRTLLFSFSASALWAMLPLVARQFGSEGYGVMLGCFGLGAMAGAILLPRLRGAMSCDTLVAGATILFAAVLFTIGRYTCAFWLLCVLLFVGGSAWIAILAILNVSAQTMSPSWVRARALSLYLLFLQGGMAAGSAAWGFIASRYGLSEALFFAALGLLFGLCVMPWIPLREPGLQISAPLES